MVLIQEKNIKRDLVIGCSNITKLEPYEKIIGYSNNNVNVNNNNNDDDNDNNKITNLTDISTIEKISIYNEEINFNDYNYINPNINQKNKPDGTNNNHNNNVNKIVNSANLSSTPTNNNQQFEYIEIIQLFAFCVSAFIIIIFGFWFSIKYRTYKVPNPTVTTCYTATTEQLTNIHNENDNRNKYLKLQATTSL